MAFPDNILTKDEKVVRSLHPHWLTVIVPALIGVLIVAAAWLIVAMTPVDPTWDVVDWIIIAVALLLFLVFVVVPFLKWRTTHYVITTNRVAVRRGILSKAGQDIALSKITDVSFRQSFFDRIIGAGSLRIETAGDSQDEEFKNIPHSNQVQQLLNHLIEEDAARRGGFGQAAQRGYDQMGGRHAEYHYRPDATVERPTPRTEPTRELPADTGRGAATDRTDEDWETPPPR